MLFFGRNKYQINDIITNFTWWSNLFSTINHFPHLYVPLWCHVHNCHIFVQKWLDTSGLSCLWFLSACSSERSQKILVISLCENARPNFFSHRTLNLYIFSKMLPTQSTFRKVLKSFSIEVSYHIINIKFYVVMLPV